ncbi:hypothetical protein [Streptacidiphilus rugosus]|uniref:hypothetical protein n=1 Tax=Streptacidiphilus rugosus TaxID=405783 RepID=UPI000A5653C8|nr:hypothetical protein [Streptacidiphilus rugosus]
MRRDFRDAAAVAGALGEYGLTVDEADLAAGPWSRIVSHDGADVTLSVSVLTRSS